MPSIDAPIYDPVKCLLIGKSGAGKTGALASLAACGYKIRMIDTDKGIKTLRSLLTDSHYPYKAHIDKMGWKLSDLVNYVPIDTTMQMRSVTKKVGDKEKIERVLAPKSADAWSKTMDLLNNWKDGDINLGPVTSWDKDCILVIDSFSTMAKNAYYFNQFLNGRLGAVDEGYDYQRDIGGAQSQLTRLLELLYDSGIKCNVIIISHITWVDDSKGVSSRPKIDDKTGEVVGTMPDGYPSAIGRALSPHIGKYFNDMYVVRSSGSGTSVRRTISTVPSDGVMAKNSVFLEREYPVSSGMAQIFAAQRGEAPPMALIDSIRNFKS